MPSISGACVLREHFKLRSPLSPSHIKVNTDSTKGVNLDLHPEQHPGHPGRGLVGNGSSKQKLMSFRELKGLEFLSSFLAPDRVNGSHLRAMAE